MRHAEDRHRSIAECARVPSGGDMPELSLRPSFARQLHVWMTFKATRSDIMSGPEVQRRTVSGTRIISQPAVSQHAIFRKFPNLPMRLR